MTVIVMGNVLENTLDLPDGFLEQSSGVIHFMGRGSSVKIGHGSSGYNIAITVEHNCTVDIGVECALGALEIFSVRGSSIKIGSKCGFTSKCEIHAHERNTISMGDGCLVASNSWLTSSDMHPIIDLASGNRINPGADINIGSHVWIANNVTVLKGVEIGNGSIVGTSAVVTAAIGSNCLAVGNPAKVIKQNVTWKHHL